MPTVTMTLEEFEALRGLLSNPSIAKVASTPRPSISKDKPKRKASAYSKKYGRAFKSVASKYKLKNGSWAKDGFKRAQKAAHTAAKKMR